MIQFNTPLHSSQLFRALRATLFYRIITIVVALLSLPARENLPENIRQWYSLIPYPLLLVNIGAILFAKPLTGFLRRHASLLFIDLAIAVGIIFTGGGWRSSYFVYTLTTVIIFTLFAHRKGAVISALVLSVISLCKNPLPEGDPIQIFEVTNWDMRLGASLFYLTACLILSYFSTLMERLNSLSEERISQAKEHSVMKQKIDLAFDLHDQLKSKLSAVMMIAGMLVKKTTEMDGQTAKDIQRLWQWLSYCQNELNQMVLSLKGEGAARSRLYGDADLCEIVRKEIDTFSMMTGFYWSLKQPGNQIPVPESMESSISSFISEAMTNAWKHSGVSEGSVLLHQENDHIRLEIIDNGKGFDMNHARHLNTSGMASLFKRSKEIMGEMTIKTSPGNGCRCALTFSVSAETSFLST